VVRCNDHPMALRCRERAPSTSSNRGHMPPLPTRSGLSAPTARPPAQSGAMPAVAEPRFSWICRSHSLRLPKLKGPCVGAMRRVVGPDSASGRSFSICRTPVSSARPQTLAAIAAHSHASHTKPRRPLGALSPPTRCLCPSSAAAEQRAVAAALARHA
jgi:hypothetical protein